MDGNTREYKGLRKLFQEALKVKTIREMNDVLNPKPIEATPLTLVEQQYLVKVTLRLTSFIREIHYNHSHNCSHPTGCVEESYQYIAEIGD